MCASMWLNGRTISLINNRLRRAEQSSVSHPTHNGQSHLMVKLICSHTIGPYSLIITLNSIIIINSDDEMFLMHVFHIHILACFYTMFSLIVIQPTHWNLHSPCEIKRCVFNLFYPCCVYTMNLLQTLRKHCQICTYIQCRSLRFIHVLFFVLLLHPRVVLEPFSMPYILHTLYLLR